MGQLNSSCRGGYRLEPDIPPDQPEGAQLERAQARVDELLEALRRETARLSWDAESALTFRPDNEQPE
jgi:hypothetical protein